MAGSTMPKWATPERQALLASILSRYAAQFPGGWQVRMVLDSAGLPTDQQEYYCPAYEAKANDLIKWWVADSRQQREFEWELEQKRIHSLGEKVLPLRGRFSATSREIYHNAQPLYHLIALGVSGITHRAFAKVRLASSYEYLYIDLGDSLKRISKHKRRKVLRYGGNFPVDCERKVACLIQSAVMHHRA